LPSGKCGHARGGLPSARVVASRADRPRAAVGDGRRRVGVSGRGGAAGTL